MTNTVYFRFLCLYDHRPETKSNLVNNEHDIVRSQLQHCLSATHTHISSISRRHKTDVECRDAADAWRASGQTQGLRWSGGRTPGGWPASARSSCVAGGHHVPNYSTIINLVGWSVGRSKCQLASINQDPGGSAVGRQAPTTKQPPTNAYNARKPATMAATTTTTKHNGWLRLQTPSVSQLARLLGWVGVGHDRTVEEARDRMIGRYCPSLTTTS